MKIAICEDEKEYQLMIEKLVRTFTGEEIIEQHFFSSGEELVQAYENKQRFSIIFLDMQMKELGGIETAKIIRKYDKKCVIIIITAILEYAMDGYSVNAFDFILKPINQDKFRKVLLKAIHKVKFFDHQTYVIETREKTQVLQLSDILYIESHGRKVILRQRDASYESNENISTVEKKLIEKGFLRISRYFLINIRHIKEIGVNDVQLSDGSLLTYSHKFANDIKRKYMIFMMEGMI